MIRMANKENNGTSSNKNSNVPNKFGTFSGVFVPSVLAILGAVMYYISSLMH